MLPVMVRRIMRTAGPRCRAELRHSPASVHFQHRMAIVRQNRRVQQPSEDRAEDSVRSRLRVGIVQQRRREARCSEGRVAASVHSRLPVRATGLPGAIRRRTVPGIRVRTRVGLRAGSVRLLRPRGARWETRDPAVATVAAAIAVIGTVPLRVLPRNGATRKDTAVDLHTHVRNSICISR